MTQIVTEVTATARSVEPESVAAAGAIKTFIGGLRRSVTGTIGFVVFVLLCLMGLLGPYLVTPDKVPNAAAIYQGPSAAHWLGTDSQGYDVLKQIIAGGQGVIVVGLVSAGISTFIAISLGAAAAYRGGFFDSIIVQLTDFVLTVPMFALLVVLSAYLRLNNTIAMAVLLGLLGWPGLLRAVRAQVLSLREREYVEAAKLLGLGTPTIIFRDILPNMASYLMIHFILAMTGAVYALSGLYLLGLAPMSGTNWGIMMNNAWMQGAIFYRGSWSYILSPLAMIALLQLSAIWLVRSLEEMLNPRLRTQG